MFGFCLDFSKNKLELISENYIFNSIIIDVDDASKLCETKADIENKMESTIAVNDMVSSLKANE